MTRQNVNLRNLISQYQNVASLAELHELLHRSTRALGFAHFMLIHHTDPSKPNDLLVHLHNYPANQATAYFEEQHFRHDPVLQACNYTNVGFAWDEIHTLIQMTPRLQNTLNSCRGYGLGEGYTVPAHVPGEPPGSCSFVTKAGIPLPRENLIAAELIGSFAFQAGRRITGLAAKGYPTATRLTQRQRDCVYWMARGKTDWEIATILGIGEETVTQHINLARKRYCVDRRTALAVRAVHDGQVSAIGGWH
ncbi:MAG: LuxR family transcriptional regulator [Sphingomonadaceae bacterium]|nr:LuxR family transcriptional regulator [Sphingomonadaceae bacterium]